MDTYDEITSKHMASVKAMGILDDEIELNQNDLKEISMSLGMTEEGWTLVLKESDKKLTLAESHFRLKSYRECIKAAEDAQLLNPFINGARGIKAKAFLLMAIHEEDEAILKIAEKQAKLTLSKESSDKNALEVMATLSSKKRIVKAGVEKQSNKSVLYVVLGMVVLLGVVGFWYMSGGNPVINESHQQVENVEKQLESGYEKQLVLIPKVLALLGASSEDETSKKTLDILQSALKKSDMTAKERYELNIALAEELSAVVYRKSAQQDSKLLENLRVLLEGAQNRINTERKNYNDAVTNFNSSVSGTSTEQLPKL